MNNPKKKAMQNNLAPDYGTFLSKPFTFDRFIRLLLSISLIIGVIFIVRSISNVLIPFFIALLLAYLTDPVVVFLQNRIRIKSRGLSVFITMLLFLVVLTGSLWWLIPRFISEFAKMTILIQKFLQTHDFQEFLPKGISQWIYQLIANRSFQTFLEAQDVSQITNVMLNSMRSIFTGSLSLVFGVVGLLMVLLYLFFILLDYKKIEEGWQSLIPQKHRPLAISISDDLKLSMRVYFRAQCYSHRIFDYWYAHGCNIGIIYWASEYRSLSAGSRIFACNTSGIAKGHGNESEFWSDSFAGISGDGHRSGDSGNHSHSQDYGKSIQYESGNHSSFAFDMGKYYGNIRDAAGAAFDHFDILVLQTVFY